jgi:hypothetical protein
LNTKKIATLLVTSAATLVAAYAIFLIYVTWPVSVFSIGNAGAFGDSFGILTSLFSALAFTGMIITILLQKDELSLQREELSETRKEIRAQKEILRLQNFNSAFYRLLDYYKQNLDNISITDKESKDKKNGISALRFLLSQFTKSQQEYRKYYSKDDEESLKVFEFHLCLDIHRILLKQARYLGTFKSLLYLVHSQLDSDEEKMPYWKIISSQLTVYELKYLFYQSLVDIDGEFSQLIDESSILDERIVDIGILNSIRHVYERLHGVTLVPAKSSQKLPHNRKSIRKIKRRIERELKEHNK